jgi:hypothetical protein
MQGAQKLRSEAYLQVRCNDEVEAQRRRWTFYETIKIDDLVKSLNRPLFVIPMETGIQSCGPRDFGRLQKAWNPEPPGSRAGVHRRHFLRNHQGLLIHGNYFKWSRGV